MSIKKFVENVPGYTDGVFVLSIEINPREVLAVK